MARVPLVKPENNDDPIVQEMFDWVTSVEGDVPNHFYLEMNFPEHFKAKIALSKKRNEKMSRRKSHKKSGSTRGRKTC